METIITLIVNDPLKAITILALALCAYLILLFKKSLVTEFDSFKKKLDIWENSVTTNLVTTQKALNTHSENLGKATKAISGDMLKIKENLFELKRELIIKVDESKTQVSNLERDAKTMAHVLQMTTEQFDAKFGRIIEFKKELEIAHGKIIRIEETAGKTATELAKHQQWIEHVARTLKRQKELIETIKAKKGTHEI